MPKCRRCQTSTTGRAQLCEPCRDARPGTAQVVDSRKAPAKKPGTPKSKRPVQTDVPAGLHRRGAALWQDLDCKAGTLVGELGLELCRMADRLDELDRIIAGKGVLQLMKFRLEEFDVDTEGDTHLTVKVNFQSVLTEARGQQTTFKELLKEYRAAYAAAAAKSPAPTPAPGAGSGQAAPASTGLDEVTQRRRAREQKTS